jgi:apolipoprotein N-acyltransferase
MKKMKVRNAALAGLSGLMLTASFPSLNLEWIAWIAFVPLFIAIQNQSPLYAFKLGFIAGLCHYLTLLYWIIVALHHYGGIPLIPSIAVLLLLVVYLALYPGFFVLFLARVFPLKFSSYLGAGIWISLEYARAHLLTGFPWCLLGYSQFLRLPLLQVADITGVYGISFLVILVNLILFKLLVYRSHERKQFLAAEVAIMVAMVGLVLSYGYYYLEGNLQGSGTDRRLRVAIVQGNIDQSVKWDEHYQQRTMSIYEMLSQSSIPFRPHLILWPETAVPFFFHENTPLSQSVYRVAQETGADILFGSPAYEKKGRTITYYNRVYLLNVDGHYTFYDKVHLLPFGEYIPLKRFLPFVHRLVPAAGDFTPGKRLKTLGSDNLLGPLICYEAIFPEISRELALQGAELLVNVTNDAWFGRTSAPYQHLSMAVLRCIETRLPMARAANTGLSSFILPDGSIAKQSMLFTSELLTYELPLEKRHTTFYSLYGDIFAILVLVVTILWLAWALVIKKELMTWNTRRHLKE